MPEIVFATNNQHKISEVRQILGDSWQVLSLKDIGCTEDIPETADTLRGNAEMKARYVKDHYGYDCFADDTGLMVDQLKGAPGVYSARYAGGEGHDSQANMRLLLKNLKGKDNSKAHFSTVIALIIGTTTEFFEGEVHGIITEEPRGTDGFGYDPIFLPDEANVTFAEMDSRSKNMISHRGRAIRKLVKYLSDKK